MIKNIVKRNGQIEAFDPNKVNGWGEWAAKTLGTYVDWASAVLHASTTLPETCTSEDLQKALIDYCISRDTWEYQRMAGRLYSALLSKTLYGAKKPTIKELHARLYAVGLMKKMNFSDDDYAMAEKFIVHGRDLKMTHYQIQQLRKKYAIQNRAAKLEYESPQFVYMRMAMALAEDEGVNRMEIVKDFYDEFSLYRINPPTPNFTNLGTNLNGYASCCLYTTDDTWPSLAAGDHIAYAMTAMSAGIGSHIKTRSIGDPIRGGSILHQGKIPYYRAADAAKAANLQNGRGGAMTTFYTGYDPEVKVIQALRNPMTPASKQVKGIDYNFGFNSVLAEAVRDDKPISLFSVYWEPELYAAQYSKNPEDFRQLYADYCARKPDAEQVPARELAVGAVTQSFETGRHYLHNFEEMNRHTPFKEPIFSSNLCAEIAEPTKAYASVAQLYERWNESHGEIALCSLGGVIVSNIANDEQYAKTAYYTLKMITYCIHKSHYVFPSLEDTAKARMNAGVGILGLAHLMAKKNMKFDTLEGRNFAHELAETHYWHLVKASLRISKEIGVAPWMHKTLWPEGWTPLSTYNRNVDSLVTVGNKRDWEGLSAEIVANGGIAHSVLCAHMPGESSTIAAGTTNGVYPIRDTSLNKTNDTNALAWVAPDSTVLKDRYQRAWDTHPDDMLKFYAVLQKWCDQSISADLWRRLPGAETVGTKEIIRTFLTMWKFGVKTRYYFNLLTGKSINLNSEEPDSTAKPVVQSPETSQDEPICTSCSL